MFVYQQQLEHLLSPRDYFDPEIYERERKTLFLPNWHCLATRSELPRHGDYRTLDLFGEPILVRNHQGTLHAYLNVCAHRHCRLTGKKQGNDPHFRCQYHGWEYQEDGRTAKIPEARCFRPFDRENAHLVKFRTETWGEMTFVSLVEEGPSLAEVLGPLYEQANDWLTQPFRFAWSWQADYEANWKIVVENTLESYHIPCLHAKTLGVMPEEEGCQHDLCEQYTTFRTPETSSWISQIQNGLVRAVGGKVSNIYLHHHVHPHLWFVSMDVLRLVQSIEPTSATSCRHRVWLYTLEGTRRNPWAWLVRQGLTALVSQVARKVILEDAPIFAEVQRGMQRSRVRGVIGTREERIYSFQRYVKEALSTSRTPGSAPCETNEPASGGREAAWS